MKNLIKRKRMNARVNWPNRKPEAKPYAPEEEEGAPCCCAAAGVGCVLVMDYRHAF